MRYSIQALAFFIIVPFISFNIHKPFLKMIFENKPIIFTGKLSYSLYLFHWVAFTWASSYFNRLSINWIFFTMFFTVTLSLSSYYFVERPFISLRKRLGPNVN
jgi:peptidoglycan/LPS O-acetylase OafA/YrhL